MDIDGAKLKRTYVDQGYTQATLSDATKKIDTAGQGICSKTISRGCSDNHLHEDSVKLVARALGKDASYFEPDDPRPLEASAKAFITSEFLLESIDNGMIGLKYWGEEATGVCLWEFIKREIEGERIRRHFSDSDFADGIERLLRMNVLVRLSDRTVRVVRPSAEEVLLVLDMRLEQEIRAIRAACKAPLEMRGQIANEQKATFSKCLELLEKGKYNDLVITEASWHHAWCGDKSSVRRVIRNNLNLAMQVGDRMLIGTQLGYPRCREERFGEEFQFMLEELRQMNEIFERTADYLELKERITVHVGRSKRIIGEVESERKVTLKKRLFQSKDG